MTIQAATLIFQKIQINNDNTNIENWLYWNFKTLYQLNPCYVKYTFKVKLSDIPIRSQQNLNLKVARAIQIKFREKSLRALGPKLWSRLPLNI